MQRRTSGDSLGRLARTTVARGNVGGGHDALIGRLMAKGGTEFDGRKGITTFGHWSLTGTPSPSSDPPSVVWCKRLAPTIWDRNSPSTGTVTLRNLVDYDAIEDVDFDNKSTVQIIPWDALDDPTPPAYLEFDWAESHVGIGTLVLPTGEGTGTTVPFDLALGIPHALVLTWWTVGYPDPEFVLTSSVRAA